MRFRPNRTGIAAVARGPWAAAQLATKAQVVARAVEQVAPERSGHFARSIRTTLPEPTPEGMKVTVYSEDIAAHIVEYGSVNNPAYAPFRRAAGMLSLLLRGGGTRP